MIQQDKMKARVHPLRCLSESRQYHETKDYNYVTISERHLSFLNDVLFIVKKTSKMKCVIFRARDTGVTSPFLYQRNKHIRETLQIVTHQKFSSAFTHTSSLPIPQYISE